MLRINLQSFSKEKQAQLDRISESSSAGRAQPCQGWGRGFESRLPLNKDCRLKRFMILEFWPFGAIFVKWWIIYH